MIAGGVICVWFGYKLFSTGSGLYKSVDKLAIKHREFTVSVTGMSAGGFLMLTSALWGFFAYSSVPHLELSGQDSIKIVRGPEDEIKNLEPPTNVITLMPQFGRPSGMQPIVGTRLNDKEGREIGVIQSVVFDHDRRIWRVVVNVKALIGEPMPTVAIDLAALRFNGKEASVPYSVLDLLVK
jgi:hypothetical protein